MLYLELFWSFFQIGIFSIGGGYAAMPLIQQQVVENHQWLTMGDFTDIVAISQMTPGPIAINAATFVGTRLAGIPGSIVATAGCVTPCMIISIILAKLYYKYRNLSVIQGVLGGLRPAVVALIASAGMTILITVIWNGAAPVLDIAAIDVAAIAMFFAALFVLMKFKIDPIVAMAGTGVAGIVIYYALSVAGIAV